MLASFKADFRTAQASFTSTKWLDASLRWSRSGFKNMIPTQFRTTNEMGQSLLKWGKSNKDIATPLERAIFVRNNPKLVLKELKKAGFTKSMAKFWRDSYSYFKANNLRGKMAPNRLELMDEILKLYK